MGKKSSLPGIGETLTQIRRFIFPFSSCRIDACEFVSLLRRQTCIELIERKRKTIQSRSILSKLVRTRNVTTKQREKQNLICVYCDEENNKETS